LGQGIKVLGFRGFLGPVEVSRFLKTKILGFLGIMASGFQDNLVPGFQVSGF
jgi:hypothetical protein